MHRAIYSMGRDADILARCLNNKTGFVDSVQRESVHRLQPGKWLQAAKRVRLWGIHLHVCRFFEFGISVVIHTRAYYIL